MTDSSDSPNSTKEPYRLVPEVALLEPLPEHLKKRFETALLMMHEDLDDALSWEQVAEKSAISPFHFHRQFTQLFNETPGRYLSRIRLQFAVSMLFDSPSKKVTEIAMLAGYSSSQALAKALKRELGMTAKAIRELSNSGTVEETTQMLAKLAHPAEGDALEYQLADELPCELVWYPQRALIERHVPNVEWDAMLEFLGEDITKTLSLTPISELDKQWKEMAYIVGEWADDAVSADKFVAEGYYLCCDVNLVSDVGYAAAIDGLFQHAENMGYELDEMGFFIEIVREIDSELTGGMTFGFQIPIKS